MKRVAVIVSFLFAFKAINAQFETSVSFRTRLQVKGPIALPPLVITPVEGGEKIKLSEIKKTFKYPDKPLLIIGWAYRWCYPCHLLIDSIVKSDLPKMYNIITINVEDYSPKNESSGYESFSVSDITRVVSEKGWSKISHYQANETAFMKIFATRSVPFLILTDKNMMIHDTYDAKAETDVLERSLSLIDNKQEILSGNRFYYQRTVSTEENAVDIYIKSQQGNRFFLDHYQKGELLSRHGYIEKNGDVLEDGPFKLYAGKDTVLADGEMENGSITILKKWWRSSMDLSMDLNLPAIGPGYIKEWDSDGSKKSVQLFVNRRPDGLTQYFYGKIKQDLIFKDGVAQSEKRYSNGLLYKEIKHTKPVSETIDETNKKKILNLYLTDINSKLQKLSRYNFKTNSIGPSVSDSQIIITGTNRSPEKGDDAEYIIRQSADILEDETDRDTLSMTKVIYFLNWENITEIKTYEKAGRIEFYMNSPTVYMTEEPRYSTKKISYRDTQFYRTNSDYGVVNLFFSKSETTILREIDGLLKEFHFFKKDITKKTSK